MHKNQTKILIVTLENVKILIIRKRVNEEIQSRIYSSFPLQSISIGKPNERWSKISFSKSPPAKKVLSVNYHKA